MTKAEPDSAPVVDTFSRFSPVIDPQFNYRAENVAETLERVCVDLGCPKTIRVDQGTDPDESWASFVSEVKALQ